MGIESFTPILTPGQITILGVGSVTRVLEERGDVFAFRSRLSLSLTLDHRAADGADGARLLQDVARHLSDPDSLAGARGPDQPL
jgi:pyruvate dehydrogenase E2 component (dihydrolipoamide acetyltransferase)